MNNDWQILESISRSLANARAKELEFITKIADDPNYRLLESEISQIFNYLYRLFSPIFYEENEEKFKALDSALEKRITSCIELNLEESQRMDFADYDFANYLKRIYDLKEQATASGEGKRIAIPDQLLLNLRRSFSEGAAVVKRKYALSLIDEVAAGFRELEILSAATLSRFSTIHGNNDEDEATDFAFYHAAQRFIDSNLEKAATSLDKTAAMDYLLDLFANDDMGNAQFFLQKLIAKGKLQFSELVVNRFFEDWRLHKNNNCENDLEEFANSDPVAIAYQAQGFSRALSYRALIYTEFLQSGKTDLLLRDFLLQDLQAIVNNACVEERDITILQNFIAAANKYRQLPELIATAQNVQDQSHNPELAEIAAFDRKVSEIKDGLPTRDSYLKSKEIYNDIEELYRDLGQYLEQRTQLLSAPTLSRFSKLRIYSEENYTPDYKVAKIFAEDQLTKSAAQLNQSEAINYLLDLFANDDLENAEFFLAKLIQEKNLSIFTLVDSGFFSDRRLQRDINSANEIEEFEIFDPTAIAYQLRGSSLNITYYALVYKEFLGKEDFEIAYQDLKTIVANPCLTARETDILEDFFKKFIEKNPQYFDVNALQKLISETGGVNQECLFAAYIAALKDPANVTQTESLTTPNLTKLIKILPLSHITEENIEFFAELYQKRKIFAEDSEKENFIKALLEAHDKADIDSLQILILNIDFIKIYADMVSNGEIGEGKNEIIKVISAINHDQGEKSAALTKLADLVANEEGNFYITQGAENPIFVLRILQTYAFNHGDTNFIQDMGDSDPNNIVKLVKNCLAEGGETLQLLNFFDKEYLNQLIQDQDIDFTTVKNGHLILGWMADNSSIEDIADLAGRFLEKGMQDDEFIYIFDKVYMLDSFNITSLEDINIREDFCKNYIKAILKKDLTDYNLEFIFDFILTISKNNLKTIAEVFQNCLQSEQNNATMLIDALCSMIKDDALRVYNLEKNDLQEIILTDLEAIAKTKDLERINTRFVTASKYLDCVEDLLNKISDAKIKEQLAFLSHNKKEIEDLLLEADAYGTDNNCSIDLLRIYNQNFPLDFKSFKEKIILNILDKFFSSKTESQIPFFVDFIIPLFVAKENYSPIINIINDSGLLKKIDREKQYKIIEKIAEEIKGDDEKLFRRLLEIKNSEESDIFLAFLNSAESENIEQIKARLNVLTAYFERHSKSLFEFPDLKFVLLENLANTEDPEFIRGIIMGLLNNPSPLERYFDLIEHKENIEDNQYLYSIASALAAENSADILSLDFEDFTQLFNFINTQYSDTNFYFPILEKLLKDNKDIGKYFRVIFPENVIDLNYINNFVYNFMLKQIEDGKDYVQLFQNYIRNYLSDRIINIPERDKKMIIKDIILYINNIDSRKPEARAAEILLSEIREILKNHLPPSVKETFEGLTINNIKPEFQQYFLRLFHADIIPLSQMLYYGPEGEIVRQIFKEDENIKKVPLRLADSCAFISRIEMNWLYLWRENLDKLAKTNIIREYLKTKYVAIAEKVTREEVINFERTELYPEAAGYSEAEQNNLKTLCSAFFAIEKSAEENTAEEINSVIDIITILLGKDNKDFLNQLLSDAEKENQVVATFKKYEDEIKLLLQQKDGIYALQLSLLGLEDGCFANPGTKIELSLLQILFEDPIDKVIIMQFNAMFQKLAAEDSIFVGTHIKILDPRRSELDEILISPVGFIKSLVEILYQPDDKGFNKSMTQYYTTLPEELVSALEPYLWEHAAQREEMAAKFTAIYIIQEKFPAIINNDYAREWIDDFFTKEFSFEEWNRYLKKEDNMQVDGEQDEPLLSISEKLTTIQALPKFYEFKGSLRKREAPADPENPLAEPLAESKREQSPAI